MIFITQCYFFFPVTKIFSPCILSAHFKHVIDLWDDGRGWVRMNFRAFLDEYLEDGAHWGGKPAQVSFGASFRAKVCSAQTSNVALPSRYPLCRLSLSLTSAVFFYFSPFLRRFSCFLLVCLPVCLPVWVAVRIIFSTNAKPRRSHTHTRTRTHTRTHTAQIHCAIGAYVALVLVCEYIWKTNKHGFNAALLCFFTSYPSSSLYRLKSTAFSLCVLMLVPLYGCVCVCCPGPERFVNLANSLVLPFITPRQFSLSAASLYQSIYAGQHQPRERQSLRGPTTIGIYRAVGSSIPSKGNNYYLAL